MSDDNECTVEDMLENIEMAELVIGLLKERYNGHLLQKHTPSTNERSSVIALAPEDVARFAVDSIKVGVMLGKVMSDENLNLPDMTAIKKAVAMAGLEVENIEGNVH